jgi:dihydropteroate synthase
MALMIGSYSFASVDYPLVMGILNVTPDSFSDGGAYIEPGRAVEHALRMIRDGARIIDVGPESTRPGAMDTPAGEQIKRAVPVIREIRRRDPSISISIDTRLKVVAEAAIDAGADMINDVSALRDDSAMVDVAARARVPVVLMHRRGSSADMQAGGGPRYDDVIGETRSFLIERMEFAVAHGIDRSRIILDPGIGFGKRIEHNLLILKRIADFVSIGRPVLIGASRKRFLGETLRQVFPAATNDPPASDVASAACSLIAAQTGAAIVRVHDVAATVAMVHLWRQVRDASA